MTVPRRLRAPLALMALLVACSGGGGPTSTGLERVTGPGSISSAAFPDGGPIPAKFTCDGANVSPPIRWQTPDAASPGLHSVLLMVDVDAPGDGFVHWLVYHAPGSGSIPEGGPVPWNEGTNSFGNAGYSGPCPPKGDHPHRYRFRLYALAPSHTPVPAGETADQLLGGIPSQAPIAEWTGTYARP